MQKIAELHDEMLSEKFDVSTSVVNMESHMAYLQTIEYFVKKFTPSQNHQSGKSKENRPTFEYDLDYKKKIRHMKN